MVEMCKIVEMRKFSEMRKIAEMNKSGGYNIARIWLELREFRIRASQGFPNSPKSHAFTISRKSQFFQKIFSRNSE